MRYTTLATIAMLAIMPSNAAAAQYTPPASWCDQMNASVCYTYDPTDNVLIEDASTQITVTLNRSTGVLAMSPAAAGCTYPWSTYPDTTHPCQLIPGNSSKRIWYRKFAEGHDQPYSNASRQYVVVAALGQNLDMGSGSVEYHVDYATPKIDEQERVAATETTTCRKVRVRRIGLVSSVASKGATCAQALRLASRAPRGIMLDDWACRIRKARKTKTARCVGFDDQDEISGIVTLTWRV